MEKKKITKRIQDGRPTASTRLFTLMRLSNWKLKKKTNKEAKPSADETSEYVSHTDQNAGKHKDRKPKKGLADRINEQAPQDNVQQGQEETGENHPDIEQG